MFEIVIGIVLLIVGWLQFAYGKLMRYKREARTAWVRIESLLRARADAVLLLLEELDRRGILEPEMEEIYEMDGGYRSSPDREEISALAEEVTPAIRTLLEKCRKMGILREEAREIEEMEQELENMAKGYNASVYAHNDVMEWPRYRLQILLLRPQRLKDFLLTRGLAEKVPE